MKKLVLFFLLLILVSCSNVKLGQLRNPTPDYNYSVFNQTISTRGEQIVDLNKKQNPPEVTKNSKPESSSFKKIKSANTDVFLHAFRTSSFLSRIKLVRQMHKLKEKHLSQIEGGGATYEWFVPILLLTLLILILVLALIIWLFIRLFKLIF